MITVTKETFFATVGQLNVHPRIQPGRFDIVTGYTCSWETPSRKVLGKSYGANEKTYQVTDEFFQANKAGLMVA